MSVHFSREADGQTHLSR